MNDQMNTSSSSSFFIPSSSSQYFNNGDQQQQHHQQQPILRDMSVKNASDILQILPLPVLQIVLSASSINGVANQYLCNLLSSPSDDIVKSVLGNDPAYNPNLSTNGEQQPPPPSSQHQQQQPQQQYADSTETSPTSFIFNDSQLQSSSSSISPPPPSTSTHPASSTSYPKLESPELIPNPQFFIPTSPSITTSADSPPLPSTNHPVTPIIDLITLNFERKAQFDMEAKNQRLFKQQQQQIQQHHQRMNLSSSTSSLSSNEDDDTDDDDCSSCSSTMSSNGGSRTNQHGGYNSYRRRSSHDIYGSEEEIDEDDDSHLESIYQCIFESYTQQRIITQPVLLLNIPNHHQYSATLVVRPLSDGCCCFFQDLSQPRTPTGLTIFNNQLRMLPSIPEDIQPTPYLGGFTKLFEHFDNLSTMFQSSPVIVWRTNSRGEMVYFKKMDDNRCQGRSLEEFLLWVHPSNRMDLTNKFKTIQIEGDNNIEAPASIQQAFYFMTGMDSRDYLLYVLRGYKVESKDQVGWVGVSFSFVMNEGAIVSVREEVGLESMFQRFKSVCEMPRGERLKLGIEDDFLSGESFTNLLKEKKLLMTEEEKKTFQRCRDTYNILFKLSLLGVMFSTLKGTIIDANDAFLSTFGYSRSDLENGNVDWMMMTPPEYYEISARALQELKSKRWCQPIEKAYFHRSGAKVPVLITAAMVDGSDEQCITFVFDLSRYRQAEESAIQANKLKSQFIANISHELRTPCHGILGMTQIILDSKELTASQRENAETIKKSTDSLISLIDDILDFSKIESGKMTLDFSSFELVPMVEQVLYEHTKLSNAKAIDLVFIMGREYPVPPVLFGDRKRIKQILSNLVSNAVKFTDAGHVLIEISTEYESGDQISLKFSVQDTGIGIPHENASQLFVPFIQLDGSNSRKHGGSGLGLSIVKELVDLMGGTLSYESKKGQGSTFWFSLKLLIAAPNYLPSSVPPANQFFYPEFRQFNSEESKKVLVVEPNQKLRMSIHSILTSIKYESMESLRIENAIDIFRMAKKMDSPFDIIMVSDTSGFIKSLLDLVTNEKVYIYGRDSKSSWANHPKVTCYLMKPLRYTQVISTLLRDSSKNMCNNDKFNRKDNNNNNNNNNNDKYTRTTNKTSSTGGILLSPYSLSAFSPPPIPTLPPTSPTLVIQTQPSPPSSLTLLPPNSTPTSPVLEPSSPNNNNNNNNEFLLTTSISSTSINESTHSHQDMNDDNEVDLASKKCILVAEDNQINQKIIVRQLDKLGYNMVVGQDGNKVLEILNSEEYNFSLILMDCQMPEMDGFECSKIIRQLEPKGQRIPIIAMTANSTAAEDLSKASGMDDYLPKPVKIDMLSQMLQKWIPNDVGPEQQFTFFQR